MRIAFALVVLVAAANVRCEDAAPRAKMTLADYLQKEREGLWDEPELPADEQFNNITLRFTYYMAAAKTEAQKDDVQAVMEVVSARVVGRVKEKTRAKEFR